jgi:chemotaxis protein MotB
MAKGKANQDEGAPAWIVTFADLMSLLVCFFVLIISFSIQDEQKLQIVAGSIREAFGVSLEQRKPSLVELDGMPMRGFVGQSALSTLELLKKVNQESAENQARKGKQSNAHNLEDAEVDTPRQFAAAAASLRQSLQSMPEVANMADQIVVEETPEGLNIQLLDKDGRSMFAAGSKTPFEHTRLVLAQIAPVLKQLPNRIAITGHTDSTHVHDRPGYGAWELTADRANSARAILAENGIPADRFHSVSGKADSEPLFPDNTMLAANRRITILLMAEAPPIPLGHRP